MFKQQFDRYALPMDSIHCTVGKFECFATLHHDDDCRDAPDERQDGFWPSLDPKDAGYIGPKSKRTLARHMAKAHAVMNAWKADEWFYCGVAVTIECDDVHLTGRYDHALWGVECNYPGSKNSYLRDVANELLPEALEAARVKLESLCAA